VLASREVMFSKAVRELEATASSDRGVKNLLNFLGVTEGSLFSFNPSLPPLPSLVVGDCGCVNGDIFCGPGSPVVLISSQMIVRGLLQLRIGK